MISCYFSDESDEEAVSEKQDYSTTLKAKLKELTASHESMLKNCNALLRSLGDLDSSYKQVGHSKEKLSEVKLTVSSFVRVHTSLRWFIFCLLGV